MFNDVTVDAINFNNGLRLTIIQRIEEVESIVNNSDENFIVWVKQNEKTINLQKVLNDEGRLRVINRTIKKILCWILQNKFKGLITKSKIAQFGLNFQIAIIKFS